MVDPCVRCNGKDSADCKLCEGTGRTLHEGCPKSMVPADVWDFVLLTDAYADGHLPVAGGMLDQAHGFCVALRFYQREDQ